MARRCLDSYADICQDESLALGLYSPDLFDIESGEVTAEALKTSSFWPKDGHIDTCGDSTGVSVARLNYEHALKELYSQLEDIGNRKVRAVEGHACIEVQEIEALDGGVLCVLDDGKSSFRSHAVVRAQERQPNGRLRLIRADMLEILNRRLTRAQNTSR